MKTKIITIQEESMDAFDFAVNEVNHLFDVFATQTHVTNIPMDGSYKILYTAVIFYRVKEE